jgi:hypothetical protein
MAAPHLKGSRGLRDIMKKDGDREARLTFRGMKEVQAVGKLMRDALQKILEYLEIPQTLRYKRMQSRHLESLECPFCPFC